MAKQNGSDSNSNLREQVKAILNELLSSGDFEFDIDEQEISSKAEAKIEALAARIKRIESKLDAVIETVGDKLKTEKPGRLDVSSHAPAVKPADPAKAAKKGAAK